jgi:site-specific recombinase XerD
MPEPDLLERFHQALPGRQPKTIDTYLSTVQDFMTWTLTQTQRKRFTASLLTTTLLEEYLNHLDSSGRAPRTRRKTLAILKVFCRWILSEGLLKYDPASPIARPEVVAGAPRELTPNQRRILKVLVEQQESTRLMAIFALGYWAGLRVSEVAELRVGQCVINQRAGEITLIDSKGHKTRTLDLHNKARLALYRYLYETSDMAPDARDRASSYVFTSQRAAWLRSQGKADHLSARGIEHLWKAVKAGASVVSGSKLKRFASTIYATIGHIAPGKQAGHWKKLRSTPGIKRQRGCLLSQRRSVIPCQDANSSKHGCSSSKDNATWRRKAQSY